MFYVVLYFDFSMSYFALSQPEVAASLMFIALFHIICVWNLYILSAFYKYSKFQRIRKLIYQNDFFTVECVAYDCLFDQETNAFFGWHFLSHHTRKFRIFDSGYMRPFIVYHKYHHDSEMDINKTNDNACTRVDRLILFLNKDS